MQLESSVGRLSCSKLNEVGLSVLVRRSHDFSLRTKIEDEWLAKRTAATRSFAQPWLLIFIMRYPSKFRPSRAKPVVSGVCRKGYAANTKSLYPLAMDLRMRDCSLSPFRSFILTSTR
jgi:hypothetical protein